MPTGISSTASGGTITGTGANSGTAWTAFTIPNFAFGTASTFSFAAFAPSGHDFFTLAPGSTALPSGVTLNSASKRFEYDGTGSVGTVSGIQLRSLNMETEWSSQSLASGVFYRHNFRYRNAAESLTIGSTAEMLTSRAGFAGGTDGLLEFDTTNKLSGLGSCRFNFLTSNPGAYSNFPVDFTGIGLSAKTQIKHQFYVRFAVYSDGAFLDHYYGGSSVSQTKFWIGEAWNSSFDPGEVVLSRMWVPGGFVTGYRFPRTGLPIRNFQNEWAGYSTWQFYPFYDAGSPTVVSKNTLQQRHGPTYPEWSDSSIDSDFANAPRLVRNGWTVHEFYIDQVNDVIKHWMAPYGFPPVMVLGSMSAQLPTVGSLDGATSPVQLYTGMQFTNHRTTHTTWHATNTFFNVSEFVVSDNAIDFPGGFTPANASPLAVPSGYPYAGSVED